MAQNLYLIIGIFFILICSPLHLISQTNIENGGLEEWTFDEGGQYYEPTGYWATANPISKLSSVAPITTFREEEKVYAGLYAAKMVTGLFATLPVAGTIYSGEFDDTEITNPVDAIKLGVPFEMRPQRFRGFYIYEPMGGDSAAISCQLTKYVNGTQEIIGEANLPVYDAVLEYTEYDLEFEYYSTEQPDTMIVAFSSSAGGQEFMGVEGSTLYIDEVQLEMTTGLFATLQSEIDIKVFPNPTQDYLNIKTPRVLKDGKVSVYNQEGKRLIQSRIVGDLHRIETVDLMTGTYIYQIHEGDQLIHGGLVEVMR